MRRIMLVFFVVLLLALPMVSASAQTEDQGLWNLTQDFTVTDLGFMFKFPENWVFDTSTGIALAENNDDLAVEIDSDSATLPKGLTVRLAAYTIDQVGLTETATLDEVVEAIVSGTGLVVEEQFELPVLTRRTVNLSGTASNGRSVLATIWLQDSNIVIWELNTPNSQTTLDYAFSWGQLLSTAQPLDTLPLTAKPVTTDYGGVSLLYPADWEITSEESPWQIADTANNTGYSLFLVRGPMSDFITTPDATMQDVLDAALPILQLDPENVTLSEHLLFQDAETGEYNSAIGIVGQTTTNAIWIKAVLGTLPNGEIFIIVHGAPDEASVDAFESTWLAVLNSLTPTDATSGQ